MDFFSVFFKSPVNVLSFFHNLKKKQKKPRGSTISSGKLHRT